jgi:hypothetical protein
VTIEDEFRCPDGSTPNLKWFNSGEPGGTFEEFNNFGSQVYVVGSMNITTTPGTTIRAIYYCGGIAQVIYEVTVEAGTLVEAGGYFEHYQKIQLAGGGFITGQGTSYGAPAYVVSGRLFKFNTYNDFLSGTPTDVTGSAGNVCVELIIQNLRRANGTVIIDYTAI